MVRGNYRVIVEIVPKLVLLILVAQGRVDVAKLAELFQELKMAK